MKGIHQLVYSSANISNDDTGVSCLGPRCLRCVITGFCPNYVNHKTKGNKHNFSVILNKTQIIHKVSQRSLQTENKGFPL